MDTHGIPPKTIAIGVAVAGGLGLLIVLLRSNSSSSSSSTPDFTQGGFSVGGTLYVPTQEYNINNNYNYGTENTSYTTNNTTSTTGTTPQTTTQIQNAPTAVSTSTTPAVPSIATLPKTTTPQQVAALTSQPGVNAVRTPSGKVVVATGPNSYGNAVNAAGGQWLKAANGQSYWYAGYTTSNGAFVTTNAAHLPTPEVPNHVIREPNGQLVIAATQQQAVDAAGGQWINGKWVPAKSA